MKNVVLVLFFILFFSSQAFGTASSIDETKPATNSALVSSEIRNNFVGIKDRVTGWISASAYSGGINEAIAACTNTTLAVGEAETLSATLNVPAGCHVKVFGSGSITKASTFGINFAVGSSFEAPPWHQVFIGFDTDDVTGLTEAYPDYWGENTSPGTTDMSAEVQSAFKSILASNGTVKFLPVTYSTGTTKVELGDATANEQKVTAKMPPGSLIKGSIAGDYLVQCNNLRESDLEFRLEQSSATGHGLGVLSTGANNSLSNKISGSYKGVATTAKPAATAGTRAITIDAPAGGQGNYYNMVRDAFIDTWDNGVYFEYLANANHVENVAIQSSWNGVFIGSSQNTVTDSFFESMKGDAVNGTSSAIQLGDGTNNSQLNIIKTAGEPGATVYQKFITGTSLAINNIVESTNNSGNSFINTVALDMPRQNILVDKPANMSLYDLTVQNGLGVNGLILQRTTTEYPNGGFIAQTTKYESHTLAAAASSTTAMNIPLGVVITGVSLRVSEVVSDTAGDDTWTATFTTGADTEIIFTPNGGNFNGGKIDVAVYYSYLDSIKNVP